MESPSGHRPVGKPRPVVVVQDDSFDRTESVTICPFTTDATTARLGARIGRLDDEDMVRLNQAMLVFLGLAISARSRSRN